MHIYVDITIIIIIIMSLDASLRGLDLLEGQTGGKNNKNNNHTNSSSSSSSRIRSSSSSSSNGIISSTTVCTRAPYSVYQKDCEMSL